MKENLLVELSTEKYDLSCRPHIYKSETIT